MLNVTFRSCHSVFLLSYVNIKLNTRESEKSVQATYILNEIFRIYNEVCFEKKNVILNQRDLTGNVNFLDEKVLSFQT